MRLNLKIIRLSELHFLDSQKENIKKKQFGIFQAIMVVVKDLLNFASLKKYKKPILRFSSINCFYLNS